MSGTLYENDEVQISYFYGGMNRGRCIQITPLKEYNAELTIPQVLTLIDALTEWLGRFD